MNEIWKQYKDTNYSISNFGNVYSHLTEKLLNPFVDSDGYFQVMLRGSKKAITRRVHRLVAEAFIHNPENKSQVNHIDGNKSNNVLENLEWNTPFENVIHSVELGLSPKGEKSYLAKLSENDVVSIKDLIINGFSNQELANEFKVDSGTIGQIRSKKTWKHINPELNLPKSSHTRNTLSANDIPKIRAMDIAGETRAAISRVFGVDSSTIYKILSGKTWKNY